MPPALIAADVNTLWRRKPFEALAAFRPVVGLEPMDPLAAWRAWRWPFGTRTARVADGGGTYVRRPVLMPPGWATRRASAACRRLAVAGAVAASERGAAVGGWAVTSPHYGPMRAALDQRVPLYYYCSDDYTAYEGWGGEAIRRRERELVLAAEHSFFVSRVLAERTVAEYGVSAERVSVSPNATEAAFLQPVDPVELARLRTLCPDLHSPVAGVVGGINDRLDFDLLRACAVHLAVGTLLMIGPVDPSLAHDPAWRRLRAEKRCVTLGVRPHAELPAWMALLDVALIPYRPTALNRACSPMRLFDGLASGKPVVATAACEQVREYAGFVGVAEDGGQFIERVAAALAGPRPEADAQRQRDFASTQTWRERAAAIHRLLPS